VLLLCRRDRGSRQDKGARELHSRWVLEAKTFAVRFEHPVDFPEYRVAFLICGCYETYFKQNNSSPQLQDGRRKRADAYFQSWEAETELGKLEFLPPATEKECVHLTSLSHFITTTICWMAGISSLPKIS
jgi:hypothetical protein